MIHNLLPATDDDGFTKTIRKGFIVARACFVLPRLLAVTTTTIVKTQMVQSYW